jgi:hypothetical protein
MKTAFAIGVATGIVVYHRYIYRHRVAVHNYRRAYPDGSR